MTISYASITRETLEQVVALSNWLVQWGPHEKNKKTVQDKLQRIERDIKHLAKISQHFVDEGNKQYDLRAEQIRAIHLQIGEIYDNETRLTKDINELAAQLVKLQTSRELTEKDVAETRSKIAQNMASLAERKAKLEELQKWFWVPGYGQYLAIRTLVDNDVHEALNLVSSVTDLERKLQGIASALNEIPQTQARLNQLKAQYQSDREKLEAFRSHLNDSLGRLKQFLVFFGNVATFWGGLNVLAADEVQFSIDNLNRKLAALERKEQLPSFAGDPYLKGLLKLNKGQQVLTISLKDAILRLADTLDGRKDWASLMDLTPENATSQPDEHYEFIVLNGTSSIYKVDWDGCIEDIFKKHTLSEYMYHRSWSYGSLGVAGGRLFVANWGGWPMAIFNRDGEFIQPYKLESTLNDFLPLADGRLVQFNSAYSQIVVSDLDNKIRGRVYYNRDPKDPAIIHMSGRFMKIHAVVVNNQLIVCHNGNNQLLRVDLTETNTYEYRWSVFRDLSHLGKEPAHIAYTNGNYFVSAGEDIFSFTADPASEVKRVATFPGAPIGGMTAAESGPLFVLTGRSLYALDGSGKVSKTVAVHDSFKGAGSVMMLFLVWCITGIFKLQSRGIRKETT